MFNINQVISLLIPIASITWIIFGIIQYKSKQISKIQLIQFFVSGLIICILAAYRDGYGFSENSVIPMNSMISILLTIFGLLISMSLIIGLISQNSLRYKLFIFMSVLFIIKLGLVEMIVRGIIL